MMLTNKYTASIELSKWDETFLDFAMRVSQLSYAVRLKTGAIVVQGNDDILAYSYNGTLPGEDNTCEDRVYIDSNIIQDAMVRIDDIKYDKDGRMYRLVTKPDVYHAEANVLNKMTRLGKSALGASMYCTDSPCIHCATQIAGAGIKNVYYIRPYRDPAGAIWLREKGINVYYCPPICQE